MRIESYRFGLMKVNGIDYTTDLILFPDRIKINWWREQGHILAIEDIGDILEFKPEVLIVGKGISGLMQIPALTVQVLKNEGIELIAANTGQVATFQ